MVIRFIVVDVSSVMRVLVMGFWDWRGGVGDDVGATSSRASRFDIIAVRHQGGRAVVTEEGDCG